MQDSTGVLRRRNGRLQACDPCRSRKVACDNTQPVCIRCRKRNQDSACIYTISTHSTVSSTSRPTAQTQVSGGRVYAPSPPSSSSGPNRWATRDAVSGTLRPGIVTAASPIEQPGSRHGDSNHSALGHAALTHRSHRAGRRRVSNTHFGSHIGGRAENLHSTPTPKPTTPSSSTRSVPPNRQASHQAGYLGVTSYSAVFEETSHSLSRLRGTPFIGVLPQPANGTKDDEIGPPRWTLASPTKEMALAVLRSLPPLAGKSIPVRFTTIPTDGWPRVLAARILADVRTLVGPDDQRDDSHLEKIAHILSVNSAKPVNDNADVAETWMSKYTGANLRWESLGVLLSRNEMHEEATSATSGSVSGAGEHPYPWRQTAFTCISLCINLANYFSDGNLLLVWLYFQNSVMESLVDSDACLGSWRSHGEAVTSATFLGLHADSNSQTYVPTFSSELRRRLLAHVYNIDKLSVTFLGRPPLLSSRYVSTPLPLDIPDSGFVGDADELRAAVADVDEEGWSRNNKISAMTFLRARVSLAYVKDDLIAIALSNTKFTTLEAQLDIKARTKSVYESFPTCIKFSAEQLHDYSIDSEDMFARMLVRIEYLQNLFLVERLLLKESGHGNEDELLFISFDMVAITLIFWMSRNRFSLHSENLEWLVMNYAAPGGGILCNELLRPTFSDPYHPDRRDVSRSSIIQNLSLLVGFLNWVSPSAPNADLCASCRIVIQHVLDYTLNNGPMAPRHEQNETAAGGASPDPFLAGALGPVGDVEGLFFNFDLMDTFDWLRPDETNPS